MWWEFKIGSSRCVDYAAVLFVWGKGPRGWWVGVFWFVYVFVIMLLLQSHGNYYEYGDKATHLLADQLRHHAASCQIIQIGNTSGTLMSDPTEINSVIKSIYTTLYTLEFPPNCGNMQQFLDDLEVPIVEA